MNADSSVSGAAYPHAEGTGRVIRVFYDVYNELGYGFLESVYQGALAVALKTERFTVEREVPIEVVFRGCVVGAFRPDFVLDGHIIVELKAQRTIGTAEEAQLMNYLRATRIEVGLLLNFGPEPLVRRFVFSNTRKNLRHLRSSAAT